MDQNGDVIWAIDLDPAEKGVYGQIIEIDWESDSFIVVATSFYDLLSGYVESLEKGEITVELDNSNRTKKQKDINTTNLDDYFTNDGALEFKNYQKQLKYIEKNTNAPDLDDRTFNDGDEVVLYGTVKPNFETNQHQMLAFYIGEILIQGNMDNLKNMKGNRSYHIFSVKLKVNVKNRLLIFNKKEYSILEYEEIEV